MSKAVENTEEIEQKKVTYNEAPKNEVLLGDEEEKAKSRAAAAEVEGFNWKAFWDKVTTGIFIFLMASPFLILAYIFIWFIFR